MVASLPKLRSAVLGGFAERMSGTVPGMRSLTRTRIAVVTALAMAVATFPFTIFSVLAADLIGELEISRAQVGFLVTATGLVGALVSPVFGYLTDKLGSVRAARGVLLGGVVTLAAIAAAPTYPLLAAAALLAGIPNGWTNPATNALIVDNVPPGGRGLITGVKQSGVQVGASLGGLLLPVLAGVWGWRAAVAVFVLIPVSGAVGLWGRRDSPETRRRDDERSSARLPASVKWIAVYGALSGLASYAIFGFLPLFAEEDQLWSAPAAGTLIAVVGVSGFVARIAWPPAAERRIGHGPTLAILALGSMVSAILLALAALDIAPSMVLIPAALLLGGGAIAWNAVGMLAVMDFSPPGMVGKGTGVVLLGFLGGIAVGAPLMGLSVDATGSYIPGWVAVAALFAVDAAVAGRIPKGGNLAAS